MFKDEMKEAKYKLLIKEEDK